MRKKHTKTFENHPIWSHQMKLKPYSFTIVILHQHLFYNLLESQFEGDFDVSKTEFFALISLVEGDEQPYRPNGQTCNECCNAYDTSKMLLCYKHNSLPLRPILAFISFNWRDLTSIHYALEKKDLKSRYEQTQLSYFAC